MEITVHVMKYPDRKNLMLWYRDPVSEKRVSKSAGTHNRKQAERAAAVWEAELRSGCVPDSRICWTDFRTRFESEYLEGKSDHTREMMVSVFGHVESIIDPAKLSAMTTATITRLRQEMQRKMQPTSVNGYLGHLRVAMNWAHNQGLLTKVPRFEMCTLPKRSSLMRSRPITAEEFDRLIAAVEKVRPQDAARWERLLRGLWLSGLRLSEALRLSWDATEAVCVDFGGRHTRLRFYGEGQKNRTDQLCPITPDFAEFLESTPPEDRHGLVFPLTGNPDRQLSEKRVSRTISAIGRRANVITNKATDHYCTAHDLRRSFGTRWAPRVKTTILQRLMRHASIATTLDYYVTLDADDVADEVQQAFQVTVGVTVTRDAVSVGSSR